MAVHRSIARPQSAEATTTAAAAPGRRGGAHRARWSTARMVTSAAATLAAVAVVLCAALGAGVFTAGPADAAARSTSVIVSGRVCGPWHSPAGWITYRGNTGDRGTVRTGTGWYALSLHRVARGGEWISGTAFCPAPRPMAHVRVVRFGFYVPAVPVVHHDIR